MSAPGPFNSNAAAFFGGVKSAWTSVFFLVLAGTYIGIGALAHDFGFASWWLALSIDAGLGGAGAGDPDFRARRRRAADRGGDRGHA